MATINITQFSDVSTTARGSLLCAEVPFISSADITAVASSVQSAAFDNQARTVRVVSDKDVRIAFGANPTATATSLALKAGIPEYFGVSAGQKLAAIEG